MPDWYPGSNINWGTGYPVNSVTYTISGTNQTTYTTGATTIYMAPVNTSLPLDRPIAPPTSHSLPPISEEESARIQQEQQERAERGRELARRSRREREEATRRARELLMMHLNEEQRAQFEAANYFHVEVDGVCYRITRRRSENIFVMEDGQKVEVICIHPEDNLPLEDQMLAQKLMLECRDPEFDIANRSRLMPTRRVVAAPIGVDAEPLQAEAC